MGRKGLLKFCRSAAVAAVAMTTAGLMLIAAGGTAGAASGIPTGGTKVSGGTVTWALPPTATPNYIMPFESSQFSTVNNISQFQYLLYRPLYMFGDPQNTAPVLDTQLSLASEPVYQNGDKSAVINMKSYKWSNGEDVNATDVLFWMNMMHAQKANWYAYVPSLFPDNVTNVTVNSPTQVTFTFNKAYNPEWFTDNEFGQVTPMPTAWDITSTGGSPGSGGCSAGTYGAASTDAACTAVYNYLTGLAGNLTGYATSPTWSIVDGPFTVASSKGGSFSTSGAVTLVPNTAYSGHKAIISKFEEVPFTTDDSEFNALVGGKLNVGYLPQQDVTASTSNATQPGPNNPRLSSNFYLTPWVLYGFNYATLKFLSNGQGGADGAIFSQLYFRQALQYLVDQGPMIKNFLKGYAVPTYGPVPVLPHNSLVDNYEQSNPFSYNPSKSKQLLQSHGWSVVSNGTDTCQKAGSGSGECGANIPQGTKLSFDMAYATGTVWQQQVMTVEQSAWSSVGIHVNLTPNTFNTVVSNYAPPCTSASTCNLEAGWWGGGWSYEPDYYPSGELLFQTGAGSNSSNYTNSKADSLIAATNDTNANLDQYQNYIATQLPVVWEPNADYELTEVAKNLRGLAPQNSYSMLFPEYWYYVKS
jgi:peptide/nickel transport system substrate-binding protein